MICILLHSHHTYHVNGGMKTDKLSSHTNSEIRITPSGMNVDTVSIPTSGNWFLEDLICVFSTLVTQPQHEETQWEDIIWSEQSVGNLKSTLNQLLRSVFFGLVTGFKCDQNQLHQASSTSLGKTYKQESRKKKRTVYCKIYKMHWEYERISPRKKVF